MIQLKKFWLGAFFLCLNSLSWGQTCCKSGSIQTSAQTVYSGNQIIVTQCSTTPTGQRKYRLYDDYRNIHTIKYTGQSLTFPHPNGEAEFTDCDNIWNSSDADYTNTKYALDAHWAAAVTYDYFLEKHCHNSFDGQGTPLRVYVEVDQTIDNSVFWSATNDNNVMYTTNFSPNVQGSPANPSPFTSLDYIAHEFGHGIANTVIPDGLNFSSNNKETRLISEGLADIWAICVQNYANKKFNLNKAIWEIGRESRGGLIPGSRPSRRFDNPTILDSYTGIQGTPFFYKYPNHILHSTYQNANDAHTLSTIVSHWFYLFAHGDGSTDLPVVNDLDASIQTAADIVFRAEKLYMTRNTTLIDLREMTYQAALDLHPAHCGTVKRLIAAWEAVGVNSGTLGLGSINTTSINYRFVDLNINNHGSSTELNQAYASTIIPSVKGMGYDNPQQLEFIVENTISNASNFSITANSPIVLKAGTSITFTPNFTIQSGSNVLAAIENCATPPDIIATHCTPIHIPAPISIGPQRRIANNTQQSTILPLQVYPNPSTGKINIGLNQSTQGQLSIYNSYGQLVHLVAEGKLDQLQYTYDLNHQAAGIYFVQFVTNDGLTHNQKVVLTK